MQVSEVCTRDVVIVDKEDSIYQAAGLMREFHVGDVVVVETRGGKRVPIGILTDRDIAIELIAEGVDFDAVAIKDVMSFKLITARDVEEVSQAVERMKDHGVRRLPVVDGAGALVGVLAVDDLIDLAAEQLATLVSLLSKGRKREQAARPSAH